MDVEISTIVEYDENHRCYNPKKGGGALLDLGVYPVSIAYFLFGKPKSISSQAVLAKSGVDEKVVTILQHQNDIQTIFSASLIGYYRAELTITGDKGMIKLSPPFYCPRYIQITKLIPTPFKRTIVEKVIDKIFNKYNKRVSDQIIGHGYYYEIEEVINCLNQNKIESDIIPLSETISIMETMDSIREQCGIYLK